MVRKENGFVHLNTRTSFTAGSLETAGKLVKLAKETGQEVVGVADNMSIYAWPFLERSAENRNIQPIFGMSIPIDFGGDLTLIVRNQEGFVNATRLFEKERDISIKDIWEHKEGLVAVAPASVYEQLAWEWDPQQIFLELTNYGDVESLRDINSAIKLAKELEAKTVATNRVWYGLPNDGEMRTSQLVKLGRAGEKLPRNSLADIPLLRSNQKAYNYFWDMTQRGYIPYHLAPNNPQGWFKSEKMMRKLFVSAPEAIENTIAIVRMCEVRRLPEIKIPDYQLPENVTAHELLTYLCQEGLKEILGVDKLPKIYADRLDYELDAIGNKGLDNYFLILSDLMRETREEKIRDSDMGSATGSVVCFSLKITKVDPIINNLLFERFMTAKANIPDIDHGIDGRKQDEFRDAAIKEGQRLSYRVYRIANFPTIHWKGGMQMIMKLFGFSQEEIRYNRKLLDKKQGVLPEVVPAYQLALEVGRRGVQSGIIETHASKLIFSSQDLRKIGGYAIDRDRKGFERVVFDKNKAKYVLNIDGVSNNGLSQVELMEERVRKIDFPIDEEAVLRSVFRGENIGIPFIETEWLLKVVKLISENTPDNKFTKDDITLILAISRPGVWMHMEEYMERRSGRVEVVYPLTIMEKILKETYGVIIYQEQALELVTQLAGLTDVEVDEVREAISKNRDIRLIEKYRQRFIDGGVKLGMDKREGWKWFDKISHFVEYAFLKGHALAQRDDIVWPLAVYKYYYPEEFMKVIYELKKNHYFVLGKPKVYDEELKRLKIQI